ncbi:uncharacterized protein LOC127239439 isoform X2 [Andrographis paniculata]|uniref:uncharacterized protein LOC127239439 isoform X2 n=1 Tax=Andrographis paniculata TaxID=175694 RepID=UPI0021E9A850|nr:uncharacterized protein LOC127239439 isoform X2 [Andrographis paniculata]
MVGGIQPWMKFGPNLDQVMKKCSTLLLALKFSHGYWSWKELLASFDNLTSSGYCWQGIFQTRLCHLFLPTDDWNTCTFSFPELGETCSRRSNNIGLAKYLSQLLRSLRPHLYTLRMPERRSLVSRFAALDFLPL